MTYEKNSLKVGVTGIYYFFNHPYKPRLNKYAKYNLQRVLFIGHVSTYHLQGKGIHFICLLLRAMQSRLVNGSDFYNVGMDYRYRLGRFVWVGEAATGSKGYALLNRLKYNLSSDYHLLLVHRYYSYDYWTLHTCSTEACKDGRKNSKSPSLPPSESSFHRYRLGRFVWVGEAATGSKGYALLNRLK